MTFSGRSSSGSYYWLSASTNPDDVARPWLGILYAPLGKAHAFLTLFIRMLDVSILAAFLVIPLARPPFWEMSEPTFSC